MVWACNFCLYRNADNNANCVVCRTARGTVFAGDMSRISGRIADAPLPAPVVAPAPVVIPAPKEEVKKRKSPEKRAEKQPAAAVAAVPKPVAKPAAVPKPVAKPAVAAKQPVATVAAVPKPVVKPAVAVKQPVAAVAAVIDDAMDVDEKKVDDAIWCFDCLNRVKNTRYTEARHMCNNKYCKSVTANNGNPVWVCDTHFNENHKHIFGNPDAPPARPGFGGFGGFGGGGFGGGDFGRFGGPAFDGFVFPKR